MPPDIRKLIQQKIDRLEEGQILFNPPTEMRVGVKERVEVRISKEAEDDIREGLEGRGEVTIEPIKVDSYMRVKLTGNNFTIEPDPKHEEEQMVRADDYTQWAWDVTPESSGTQKLYVRVAVKATLPEIGEKTIYAQILEKPVDVRVHPYYSTAYFCKKNWQWLLGTITGSGILGFSLGRRGKYRSAPTGQ